MKRISFLLCFLLASAAVAQNCRTANYISDSILSNISRKFDIKFVGNGNIQKSLDNADNIPANTGIGVTLYKYFPNSRNKTFFGMYRIDLEATINIASTADTLRAAGFNYNGQNRVVNNPEIFGNSILTPLNSGQAMNFEIRGYNRCTYLGVISGFKIKYTGSNRKWILNTDTVRQATVNSFRAGIFHDFVPFEHRNNYSIVAGIAFAYNSVQGDLGLKKNEAIRRQFLNTDRTQFYGYEINVGFRLKNIRADFAYSIFPSNKGEVPGLTGGRLITTISFVGGFSLDLNNESD